MLVTDFSPEIVYTNAGGAITMAGQPSLDREITTIAVRDGQIMAMGQRRRCSRSSAIRRLLI